MKISDILRHKSAGTHDGATAVVTLAADQPITALLAALSEHGIGAVVVVGPGDSPEVIGIVSERDVVRGLHRDGPALPTRSIGEVMTSPVLTCTPHDPVDDIAAIMTERRVRHMPVLEPGADGPGRPDRLVGIVSIGDVVLSRIRQLEQDRGQLESYITS